MRAASLCRLGLAFGLSLLLGACDHDAAADPGSPPEWPAGAAGTVCQLLEYDRVAAAIGTRFDTAGGAHVGDTYTCALATQAAEFPDLTLSVAPTTADEVVFTATVIPSGAINVKGLGRIAYRIGLPASGSSGPGIELGWLTASNRLMVLTYTFAPGASGDQVATMTGRLIAFAKRLDVPATAGALR
jgi:hypothetical protein